MNALWIITASFFFACMGACAKLGVSAFSTAELVFYRSFIAFLFIAGYVVVRRPSLRTPHLRFHVGQSLVAVGAVMMLFTSMASLPLTTAMTLNYTSPIFLALMLALLAPEHIRFSLVATIVAGFVGVLLLLQPTFSENQWTGALLALGSGILGGWVFYNLRLLAQLNEPEWRSVFYMLLVSSLTALVWVVLSGGFRAFGLNDAAVLLGIGSFGIAGQICITIAYQYGKTLMTANLSYSTVVFSCMFGLFFWNEALPLLSWAGMLLVIGSGVVSTLLAQPASQSSANA